jgi:hypothetical protein
MKIHIATLSAAVAIGLAACGGDEASAPQQMSEAAQTAASQPEPASNAAAATALPTVSVHKSPTCGCCGDWVKHMQQSGFAVETHDVDNLNDIKTEVGIPPAMGSCHTAKVGKYFVEGHVPAEDVKRLLAENPDAKGLTVPGMPVGSPGMESPSGEVQPYDVLLVAHDGSTSVFASHGKE